MLSETMQKKLTKHFHFRDLDQDGFVERADWEQCAQNLAEIRAWQPDSSEYEAILAKHVQIWTNFWQPADLNNDGKVSLEEYLQLADKQRRQSAFALDLVSELFGAIFEVIDLDEDGEITLQDYKLFFRAWGCAEKLAEQAFSQLDLSGDGRLSRATFLQLGANFYISDEPNVPGNWLFGPLPKNVLLLGRRGLVVEDVLKQLELKDVSLFVGTNLDDVRAVFNQAKIDIVIMGAGLDIDLRCDIIKLIYSLSDTTTVHLKDWASGPEGMLPFVNSVLKGLDQ